MGLAERVAMVAQTALAALTVKAEQGAMSLGQKLELQGLLSRGAEPPAKGDYEILSTYRNSPWVRSILGKIAQYVASVPWYLEIPRGAKTGKALKLKNLQCCELAFRDQMRARYKANDVVFEQVMEHPLLDLLNSANPLLTGSEAREVTQNHLELTGESFWALQRDPVLNIPIAYWPMPGPWVSRTPEPGKPGYGMNVYGGAFEMPEADVLWLRYRDPGNPYGRGVGYATSLGDELDTDEYASKFVKAFFYNRATPDIMIGVEGATEPQLLLARKQFEAQHRGYKRAHRPHFFSGKLSIHELTKSFAETEVVNLRSWEREAIRSVWGVPAEIMGLTQNSNRAAITTASQIMADEVIIPRLEFMRSQLQTYLVPMFDDRLVVGYESPAPDDRDLQLSYVQAVPYAATRGEIRERQGLENRGDVDNVHLTPLGVIPEPVSASSERASTIEEGGKRARALMVGKSAEAIARAIMERMRPHYFEVDLLPIYEERIKEWGEAVFKELGVAVAFNMRNPVVMDFLKDFAGERIDSFVETDKKRLRGILETAISEGAGVEDIKRRMRSEFQDMSVGKARVIARTEVGIASNFATHQAHLQSGVIEKREWVTTRDGKARPEHLALDGQIVGVNEPFKVGAYRPMAPGQFGTASQDVNCRCTTVGVTDDVPKSAEELDAIWRKFDADVQPWEDDTMDALGRGYLRSEEAVFQGIDDLL